MDTLTFGQWYAMGGVIMHLLAACSVLILAVVLERLWSLRRSRVMPAALVRDLHEAGLAGDRQRVAELVEGSPCSVAHLARLALIELRRGNEEPHDLVAAAGATEALRLRRNLPLLAAVANLATMLGLLGTVLGMIEAFDTIARVGTGDARIVAGGIFEALITTATGLSIAIFGLSFHAYFRRRTETFVVLLEEALTELIDHLRSGGGAREGPARPELQLAPAEG